MSVFPDVSEYLHHHEGFCYPDWEAVSKSIETCLPESEWGAAWEVVSRSWVGLLIGRYCG